MNDEILLLFILGCVITEYAGHAQLLVKDYDLSSIDAIIIAAGDGLLYEVRWFM